MREGLRRWAVALDVLVLLLVVILVRAWLVPGYRIALTPDLRLSLTSWPRIAICLGVVLALRYTVFRSDPFHLRVLTWVRTAIRWDPLRVAWSAFIVSRLMVFVVACFALVIFGFPEPRAPLVVESRFLDLYARWDAGWYFSIAGLGYPLTFNPERWNSIAFFPGLPLLMRATGKLFDINLWAAGVIVITAAFLWALTYVYRLARLDLGDDEARTSVILLAFYPFAVCYSAVLTESLFLLSAAAAFFHFRKNQFVPAAVFGCFAGLLRPNGCLLAVPLGILALSSLLSRDWRRFLMQSVTASMPVVGMLAYSLYVNSIVGDPFAWVKAQQAWGRRTAKILTIIESRRDLIVATDARNYFVDYPVEVLEGAVALLVLGIVWPIFRRFGLAYAVFVASAILPSLISIGPVSVGRYSAPLFPIFLWLAAVVPAAHRPYWAAVFAAGQALVAVLFFTGRPPY